MDSPPASSVGSACRRSTRARRPSSRYAPYALGSRAISADRSSSVSSLLSAPAVPPLLPSPPVVTPPLSSPLVVPSLLSSPPAVPSAFLSPVSESSASQRRRLEIRLGKRPLLSGSVPAHSSARRLGFLRQILPVPSTRPAQGDLPTMTLPSHVLVDSAPDTLLASRLFLASYATPLGQAL